MQHQGTPATQTIAVTLTGDPRAVWETMQQLQHFLKDANAAWPGLTVGVASQASGPLGRPINVVGLGARINNALLLHGYPTVGDVLAILWETELNLPNLSDRTKKLIREQVQAYVDGLDPER